MPTTRARALQLTVALMLCALAVLVVAPMTLALEVELESLPVGSARPLVPAHHRPRSLDTSRVGTLLGLPPGDEPGPHAELQPPAAPFPARLLGTLSSPVRERSVASLLLPSGRARSVWEGDEVLDAEVVAIARDAIVIRRAGALQRLTVRAPEALPAITSRARAVTQAGPAAFVVSRADVLRRLGDLYGLSREVQLVPAFRDGLPIGFRFVRIAPESAIAALGLQPGDVVRAVNGQPLDSMQRLLALAATLDRPTQLDLELERGDARLTHHYRLD